MADVAVEGSSVQMSNLRYDSVAWHEVEATPRDSELAVN